LKEQTILIRTRTKKSGKGGDEEKFDAREMASKLSECVSKLNKDVKFDSKSGLWYDMGVLVVARPGSGKTWMMQQIVHFMCECYLDDDKSAYKFVPVLFHVQRIARLYREMNEQKRFQVEQTIEARYKGGKQYYPGVIHAVLGDGKYNILYDDDAGGGRGMDTEDDEILKSLIKSLGGCGGRGGNDTEDELEAPTAACPANGEIECEVDRSLIRETNMMINTQTDALRLLEAMLRWEYDESTVRALLDCYNARTLVILLDGLDEASGLAKTFECLGKFLAKSGCRVVMAARLEGIESEDFYTKSAGWTLLDLPELSVTQQKEIANQQIENLEGSFFDCFYAFQKCRNALDAAAKECEDKLDYVELGTLLREFNCTKLEVVPEMVLSCSILAEVESIYDDDEDFILDKKRDILSFKHATDVLTFMNTLYERATVAKTLLDDFLDAIPGCLVVKPPLKKPKHLLQKAGLNNGFHNVTDVVRGEIVCGDWKQITNVLKHIVGNSASLATHHVHNGFVDPDFIHYRSLTIVMSVEVSLCENGSKFRQPIELQLHLKAMHALLPSCEVPRRFFLGQGGLCGDEKQRILDINKCMDVVHTIGKTPVLLSVFLMYIKTCTSTLSGEERDQTADVHTCPPMPRSLHFLYQEALWGALETQDSNPSVLLKVLECIAFDSLTNGRLH
jgi:hypothetical protein